MELQCLSSGWCTSPACGGGRIASTDAIRVGEALSTRAVRLAEAPPPQPSPASGRGSPRSPPKIRFLSRQNQPAVRVFASDHGHRRFTAARRHMAAPPTGGGPQWLPPWLTPQPLPLRHLHHRQYQTLQRPTLPRSRRASRRRGRRAIMPSSAPPCRSSARNSARRSISRPARRCSTSPPATAWRRWPPRGAGATSPRPITCRPCWSAAAPAPRPRAGTSNSRRPTPRTCRSSATALTWCSRPSA